VNRIRDHEPHGAINAAGKSMLARARSESWIPDVVDSHGENVVTGLHRISDVKAETRVAAFVLADAVSVHKNFCDLKHAVEFQIDSFAGPSLRHVEMFSIPAVADVKSVRRKAGH